MTAYHNVQLLIGRTILNTKKYTRKKTGLVAMYFSFCFKVYYFDHVQGAEIPI